MVPCSIRPSIRPRRSGPNFRHAIAALSLLGVTLQAARRPGPAENAPSIKTSIGLSPQFFERTTATVAANRPAWLKQAETATPRLFRRTMKPVAVVTVEKDAGAFQGWKIGK